MKFLRGAGPRSRKLLTRVPTRPIFRKSGVTPSSCSTAFRYSPMLPLAVSSSGWSDPPMYMKQLVLPLLLQRMSHLISVPLRSNVMTLRPARPGAITTDRSSP